MKSVFVVEAGFGHHGHQILNIFDNVAAALARAEEEMADHEVNILVLGSWRVEISTAEARSWKKGSAYVMLTRWEVQS